MSRSTSYAEIDAKTVLECANAAIARDEAALAYLQSKVTLQRRLHEEKRRLAWFTFLIPAYCMSVYDLIDIDIREGWISRSKKIKRLAENTDGFVLLSAEDANHIKLTTLWGRSTSKQIPNDPPLI